MATTELTVEQIYNYFKEKGNVVKNRELVHRFKEYLTHPQSKDDARIKFKKYVNTLAQTKTEGDEKYLVLKTRYHASLHAPVPRDPRNSLGIPVSPSHSEHSPSKSPAHRQPPPYRPPPAVVPSPSSSLDNVSLSSIMSQEGTPQVPPRRKTHQKSMEEETTPSRRIEDSCDDNQSVSVKERREKFDRMASMEEELSPRQTKSQEKTKSDKGAEEDDGASVTSLDPKKCMEWYVTASKGDLQELLKLAQNDPHLVNRKDPFTAYTVLHWGAKHGNPKIIQMFAGKYRVDVNGKTNGGYTPLHLAAQFGHRHIFDMLKNEYKADDKIRDYSGRLPVYYLEAKEQKGRKDNIRKIKGRKKPTDKDLGFLRIGSLNVRVKKTTEAFSNFLGVGSGSVTALDAAEKVHKGWGSADNVNQENIMPALKGGYVKKKSKRPLSGLNSTPGTPKQMSRAASSGIPQNDSDSDTAAGFDSQWKN